MTRGCPRGCEFCIVKDKEGRCSKKVAELSEFWKDQKNIVLCDPNILASKESTELLKDLIATKSKINFNQGLDIRLMTDEKAYLLSKIRLEQIHFAYDRYEDKDFIEPKFKQFRSQSKVHPHDLQVYVLVGDHEKKVLDEDLHRIYWLRENGFAPYIMIYDKENLPKGHELRRLQRWVNNRIIFWKTERFEDYIAR